MRVLITGVSGFVGGHLARHLGQAGWEVWGTTQHGQCEVDGVRCVTADLREPDSVAAAIEQSDPDAVVHLAGLSHVGRSWSAIPDYFEVNVVGAERLLEAAAGRRVIVASSAEVYGDVPQEEQPIPESRPVAPQSPYALSKAAMERLARRHEALVVRAFNIVGPGQSTDFALPTFAQQLSRIRLGRQPPVLRVGNLAARRDFLHVADAAEGYRIVLEEGEPAETYNLGSGEAVSIEEALNCLVVTSGVRVRTEVDDERVRPIDIPLLTADADKLRALGWGRRFDLATAVGDLWRWIDGREATGAGTPGSSDE